MSERKPPVVMIVGMHRSGTSAVGRLLEGLGFEFGNNLMEGIQSINDEGFWEDKEVVALNEHILELLQYGWFDFERLPGKWWEDARVKSLVGVAETWFHESFSGTQAIAVKDPRFCRLLPFWKRVFQGLHLPLRILLVFRHPTEVALSLQKRDGFSMQLGYLLWLSYTIDSLYYSGNLDLFLLHYGDLVKDPESSVQKLRQSGLFVGLSADTRSKGDSIAGSIDARKQHQKSESSPTDSTVQGDIQALAKELYEELLRSSSDEAKGLADKYRKRLYRLLDHHAEVLSAIQGGVRNYVGINQRLSKLGGDHSYALAIIREKDAQLEENKQFIERCLAEIKNKESLLMRGSDSITSQGNTNEIQHYSEKIENWMSQLNRMVDDYRNHIAQQETHIAECEQKIQAHESGLAGNQEYIAKCHARIAEQDAGIAENKGYIVACEERIRVQDEGLSLRDRDLADKTDQIISLEKQIVQFQDQLSGEHQKSLDSSEAYQQQQVVMRQLEQDILHLREENNSLSVRLSDADQSIKHKDESIFILRDEQALFRKNSEENREYIGKCHGRISEQDATLADQRVTISSLQERIHAAEERIRSQIEQMQQQDHQIHTVTSYRDELKKSMDDLQGRHDAIDLKSRDQLKSLTEKETVISDQKAIISSMEERIQGAEERMRSQIEQLQLQESAHKELRQQMSAQLALTDRIQGESQDWQERTRQTQAELDQVRQEVSRLEGLDRIHQQRLALQKQQLEKLRAHAAALESELVAIRSERVVLNAQLERYRSFRLVRTIDQIFPEKSS